MISRRKLFAFAPTALAALLLPHVSKRRPGTEFISELDATAGVVSLRALDGETVEVFVGDSFVSQVKPAAAKWITIT